MLYSLNEREVLAMSERNDELYSIIEGKKQDAHIHEAILADGDHAAAAEVSKEWAMRNLGWAREQADKYLG
jgi:hypothetical protein